MATTKRRHRTGALAAAVLLFLGAAAPSTPAHAAASTSAQAAASTPAHAAPHGRPAKPGGRAKPAPTWDVDELRASTKRSAAQTLAATAPDVTGDGRADLVVQSSSADAGAIRVYPNTGATTSNPWSSTFTTTATRWTFADLALLADVNSDARDDLIVRDPGSGNGTLWIYLNSGDAADPWAARFSAGTGWNRADTIAAGDITGDGEIDLMIRDANESAGTLWVYPGNGSSTANPWTAAPIWSGTGWNLANAVMLGDATGDGRLDVVARDGDGAIRVYPHNGATAANFWTSIISGATGFGLGDRLELADVTGDARPDIIARSPAGAIRVHPGLGTAPGGIWSAAQSFPAGTGFAYAIGVLVGDVDGDGRPDLAARLGSGQALVIRPNNTSTTANPWTSSRPAGTDWEFASDILVEDVDGDRRQDLIVLDRTDANGTLWIYLNNGAATGNPWPSRYFAGTGWNIFDMVMAGDVTGDGRADVVGRQPGGDLYAYPGNGSSTSFPWDARVWVGSNWQHAKRLALADIDGDAIADLVDLEDDNSLWIFPTATGDPIPVPGGWSGVAALDVAYVDGTGHLDLVVLDSAGAVWIHPGSGATASNPWTAPRRSGGSGFDPALSFGL